VHNLQKLVYIGFFHRLVQDAGTGSASENTSDCSAKMSLLAIQQAVVLAQCLHVSRRSRSDEMSGWEMAPSLRQKA
jgi:hypothetical protein